MSASIPPIRGMNDILPDATPRWHQLESVTRTVLAAYGYRELRVPIVEKTELFARSIGTVTDIVEKEMYSFEDRNGEHLTLRPEATAGMVRAGISNGLLYNQVQRLWCHGPMFRHERPQKGRYRQFHQVDVEAYGLAGPDIDAELNIMLARLWKALGVSALELQINTLGTPDTRQHYRKLLVDYFRRHLDALDEDSRRRLDTNPLRVLDSKVPETRKVVDGAPNLLDHLDAESQAHFAEFQRLLDDAGIRYRINPRLVRGLDYYTRTVFEWVTARLGAQDAVCSGGRYDGLVEHLGGKSTPAIGFAMGMERMVSLMEAEGVSVPDTAPHAYLVRVGAEAERAGLKLAEQLRSALPGLRLLMDCSGGDFGKQLKRADKSGARVALVLGDHEARKHEVGFKPLRNAAEQISISWELAVARLAAWVQ
ncbi:MAG TPA: histidine--tRNA ligase [Gammaproteobacteria bacterium]|nr:histidine--tRNA ligase [Gammaproteobacteria bacterium]